MKGSRYDWLEGPNRGKGGGFLKTLRERCKPFPEWAEITDYFGEYKNIGPYRTLAKQYGFILRRKDGRIYAAVAPFAVPTATKGKTT